MGSFRLNLSRLNQMYIGSERYYLIIVILWKEVFIELFVKGRVLQAVA
jgi:hypothetical protein